MKSKITLVILLVIIIFLGSLSFFLGYKWYKEKDNVQALNIQIEILKNEQEINEQNNNNTENGASQVVEVLAIPKFDSNKVDISEREDAKPTNIKEEGSFNYKGEDGLSYTLGPKTENSKQLKYRGKEYDISTTANIIDVCYQSPGYAGANFVIFLLDDGTIKYTFIRYDNNENAELEIKDYNLKNVVALKGFSYTGVTGKVISCVGAITNDGVTHLLSGEL